MEIRRAEITDLKTVKRIVHETIRAVYPHYYPKGAVEFFIAHHSPENIMKDISAGSVYILYDGGVPAGTVTAAENELNRLFVLPEYQGRGIGRLLINELLKFVNDNGIRGTGIFVELCAMPDKMQFYEKLGFDTNEAQRLKMMYQVR